MGRLRLKCDGTRAETRFRLSVKEAGPFKLTGATAQSTSGSRGVRIGGSNAAYTMFRGSVKSTGYPFLSPFPLHFPSRASPCAITFQLDCTENLFLCLIWGFRREVGEISALLGYYAACRGNFARTFRDKLSVPSSKIKKPWIYWNFKMEQKSCPETSVSIYHYTFFNIPEERRSLSYWLIYTRDF